MLGAELQLSARKPEDSYLLGVVVRGKPTLVGCALGAVFQESGVFGVAFQGEVALAVDCTADLGQVERYSGEVRDVWYEAYAPQ